MVLHPHNLFAIRTRKSFNFKEQFLIIIGSLPNILDGIGVIALGTLVFLFPCQYAEFLGLEAVFAQETAPNVDSTQLSNDKFYPHNYARSPFEGTPGGSASSKSNSRNDKKDKGSTTVKDPKVASIAPIDEPSGKSIESISLIVGGLDFAELEKSTNVLLEIFNNKNIRPSTIFIIGQSADLMKGQLNSNLKRLSLLGTNTQVLLDVPTQFKVKRLPSWIISLKDGDIVLEGLNSPIKFINSKGEFIDPKDVVGGELDEEEVSTSK